MGIGKIGVALLLAWASVQAVAQPPQAAPAGGLNSVPIYFRSSWTSPCSVSGGPTSITFTSAGGDATEDDMLGMASWPDGSSTNLGLKPGLFPQSKGFASPEGGCEGLGVTVPREGQLLLWMERDDRPSGPRLVLVLLDTKDRQVLDVVNDAGKEMWGFELCWTKSQPGLYETVLIGAYQDQGQTAEPLDLPRVMRIHVVDDHLKLTWGDWVSKVQQRGKCFDSAWSNDQAEVSRSLE
ncbi:hypothetical protein DVT68_09565 [Dyella solisilvae]|uniref:Uncharacterized protein n=1 Tax=Dyella solisilvae TaxID=1920168 RepID=A0A370K801_9GAMM|nr:hypothetical protein [Dyella solisilvae]RDI98754.1 hypothetical protein DVT68_09565 [Dyella solisilvae]